MDEGFLPILQKCFYILRGVFSDISVAITYIVVETLLVHLHFGSRDLRGHAISSCEDPAFELDEAGSLRPTLIRSIQSSQSEKYNNQF